MIVSEHKFCWEGGGEFERFTRMRKISRAVNSGRPCDEFIKRASAPGADELNIRHCTVNATCKVWLTDPSLAFTVTI
jgi:hypothetical protein